MDPSLHPAPMAPWRAAQVIGLAATIGLIAALVAVPRTGLRLLWDVAIPLLPAVFLVQPGLWRNICPLATLNLLPNRWGTHRVLDDRLIPAAGALGIGLLALLVPARRFLFNTDGTLLAVTIIGVAVLAMLLGVVFDKKAGFCSGICPVLPVEKLYGQRPFFAVSNPRCVPCTVCTTRGCIDIAQSKSVAQTLGRQRKSHAWMQSSFGVFAAGFPGFVLGYNFSADGPLSSAGQVYQTVALWAVGSYLLTQFLVRALNLSGALAIRLLAAFAFALYYWFAAAVVSDHLGLPGWAPTVIRGAALLLTAFWLGRADRASPGRGLRGARSLRLP